MNSTPHRPRRFSATACAAVLIATSLGTVAVSEARDHRVIEAIDAYCRASWRNAGIDRQDWEDCTQQVFVELLLAANLTDREASPEDSDQRRELNRSIWRVAQRWRRTPRLGNGSVEWLTQTPSGEDLPDPPAGDDLVHLLCSRDSGLSPRQCDIMQRWIQGNSVAQIAADLGLSPARVSDEKYKAIGKLRARWA